MEAEAQSGNFLLKIITGLREQAKAAVLPGESAWFGRLGIKEVEQLPPFLLTQLLSTGSGLLTPLLFPVPAVPTEMVSQLPRPFL